jgi:hypothetical protein
MHGEGKRPVSNEEENGLKPASIGKESVKKPSCNETPSEGSTSLSRSEGPRRAHQLKATRTRSDFQTPPGFPMGTSEWLSSLSRTFRRHGISKRHPATKGDKGVSVSRKKYSGCRSIIASQSCGISIYRKFRCSSGNRQRNCRYCPQRISK